MWTEMRYRGINKLTSFRRVSIHPSSSSYYKKSGLAPAHHRVRMCELAVEHTSTWLMVDPWEAGQPEYQRTAVVLDHFDEMLNGKDGQGGVEMRDGSRRKYKVMLLAGGDLIESFGEPGVWSEPDVSRHRGAAQGAAL